MNLDLRPALKRCEAIHGHKNCLTLWGTLAVKKCPRGYNRFGCCQCVLPCPSVDFVDVGQYCQKPQPYLTHLYGNLSDCKKRNKLETGICTLFGVRGYTEKCDQGYMREGEFNCRKECPHGWPDDGSFCTKISTVTKQVPFPWMPGDMALNKKYVKKRQALLLKQQEKAQLLNVKKREEAVKKLEDRKRNEALLKAGKKIPKKKGEKNSKK